MLIDYYPTIDDSLAYYDAFQVVQSSHYDFLVWSGVHRLLIMWVWILNNKHWCTKLGEVHYSVLLVFVCKTCTSRRQDSMLQSSHSSSVLSSLYSMDRFVQLVNACSCNIYFSKFSRCTYHFTIILLINLGRTLNTYCNTIFHIHVHVEW